MITLPWRHSPNPSMYDSERSSVCAWLACTRQVSRANAQTHTNTTAYAHLKTNSSQGGGGVNITVTHMHTQHQTYLPRIVCDSSILEQSNILFFFYVQAHSSACVCTHGGKRSYFSLQPLITSFYHTVSFSTHWMLYLCLHAYVVLCTYVSFCPESCLRQSSDLFTPHLWSGVQTGTGSWGKAWKQMSSVFSLCPRWLC